MKIYNILTNEKYFTVNSVNKTEIYNFIVVKRLFKKNCYFQIFIIK